MNAASVKVAAGVGLSLLLMLATTLLAQSGLFQSAPTSVDRSQLQPKRRSSDDYRIIFERNVFSRNRSTPAPVPPRVPAPETSPPRPVEVKPTEQRRQLILTGIVLSGSDRAAMLEDAQSGVVTRVRPGESGDFGTVLRIEVDHLLIEFGGQRQRVDIGSQTSGSVIAAGGGSTAMSASDSTGGSAVTTEGAPASVPSSAEAAILERLRARRAREAGQ